MDATGKITDVSVGGNTVSNNTVSANTIILNDDGTLNVYSGQYQTATRKTTGATAPAVPKQFANYYTAENILASEELNVPAKVTLEGSTQPNQADMEVEWQVVDGKGNTATYDATPTAANTFKWTVKPSEYAEYDVNDVDMEGTITIQNKDYTPVNISGSDVEITYDGNNTLDVSKYFTIDKNAGTPTYELLNTSTGTGKLSGSVLTINTLGTFVIKVSTPINGVYNKGEHTLTITVKKAASDLKELPVGTIKSSDDGKATYKVTTSDLTNGCVTYVAPTDKKASTVTIPAKTQTIGKQAFYGCKILKTVTIGKNVSKIGSKAFYSCSKLKTLTIKSTKLSTKKVGSKAFSKTPKSITVKVLKKKLNTYKTMLTKRGVNKKAKFKKI